MKRSIGAPQPGLRQVRSLCGPRGIGRPLPWKGPRLQVGQARHSGRTPRSQLGQTSGCITNVLDPTGDVVINDQFSTGATNFREFFYGIASQAGEGSNFDGNGRLLRIQPAGGPLEVATDIPGGNPGVPGIVGADNVLYGNTIAPPIGTQPLKPSSKPPVKTSVQCQSQDVPDLNGPLGGIGAPNPAVDGEQNVVIP